MMLLLAGHIFSLDVSEPPIQWRPTDYPCDRHVARVELTHQHIWPPWIDYPEVANLTPVRNVEQKGG